ncbi:MAG: ATP-dependent RNA helicase DeaD, partial [Candidatus Azotimanducaceae bacterium]
DAKNIGHIDIYSGHSIVDLPAGMPRDVFRELKKVWVCGRQLHISHDTGEQAAGAPAGAPADAAPTARTPAREHRTTRAPTTGDQEAPERSDKKRSPPSRDKPVVKRKVRTADKKSKGKPVNKKPRPSS